MKKVVFTLIALTFMKLGSLNAQTFTENYLGVDFMMYKGALFKVNDDAILGFGKAFFSDLSNCQSAYNNNVIYPDATYSFNTIKDSLINRIFRLEDIIGLDGKPYVENYFRDKPIFLLRDTSTNQVIYYLYDMKSETHFPFLTSKINYSSEILCSKIQSEFDDFTQATTFYSPIFEGDNFSSVGIDKVIKAGKSTYYLSLKTTGSTLNVGKVGLIVLFDNGTKLNKPSAKIDVEYEDGNYAYSAWIPLTEVEVKSLTTKKITKFRLYIYDEEVDPVFSEKFTYYVKCVIDKK